MSTKLGTWLSLWAAAILFVTIMADMAFAARRPTVAEGAGIRQAIFDYFAKGQPSHPIIKGITVSTRQPVVHLNGGNQYEKFARVNLYDKAGGPAAALLGYYVSRLSGWRVLDLGSAEVGCRVSANVFQGRKSAILRDLKLDCP